VIPHSHRIRLSLSEFLLPPSRTAWWMPVLQSKRKPATGTPPAPTHRIFTVMENGQLLGIVSERQAALFPDRIFADLLLLRPPPTGAATTRLEQTLARLEEGPWDACR